MKSEKFQEVKKSERNIQKEIQTNFRKKYRINLQISWQSKIILKTQKIPDYLKISPKYENFSKTFLKILNKIEHLQRQVVRNTQIMFTIFQKYSKRRSDPDCCVSSNKKLSQRLNSNVKSFTLNCCIFVRKSM